MNCKTFLMITLASLILVAVNPVDASAAETFSGMIEGFTCMVSGKGCPRDNMDPHLMLESDFVLVLGDGNYYLLPNISRDVKAKYYSREVKVSGKVNEKYRALMVNTFEVKEGSSYKTVWTAQMAREEMEKRLKEWYSEH